MSGKIGRVFVLTSRLHYFEFECFSCSRSVLSFSFCHGFLVFLLVIFKVYLECSAFPVLNNKHESFLLERTECINYKIPRKISSPCWVTDCKCVTNTAPYYFLSYPLFSCYSWVLFMMWWCWWWFFIVRFSLSSYVLDSQFLTFNLTSGFTFVFLVLLRESWKLYWIACSRRSDSRAREKIHEERKFTI